MCFGYVFYSILKLMYGKSVFLGVCEFKGVFVVCCIINLVI